MHQQETWQRQCSPSMWVPGIFLLCEFQGSTSSYQVWQQVLLPTKSALWPHKLFMILSTHPSLQLCLILITNALMWICAYNCPRRPEVSGLLDVGAGNQIQVLYKNTKLLTTELSLHRFHPLKSPQVKYQQLGSFPTQGKGRSPDHGSALSLSCPSCLLYVVLWFAYWTLSLLPGLRETDKVRGFLKLGFAL